MGKHAKSQKQKHWKSMNSKLKKDEVVDVNDMDDEIDACNYYSLLRFFFSSFISFPIQSMLEHLYLMNVVHKKRDMIPLDFDDDSGESDEDDEQAVFNYEVCYRNCYCYYRPCRKHNSFLFFFESET